MGCLTENGQSVKKRSKAAKEALVELVEKPKQKVCMYEKKKKSLSLMDWGVRCLGVADRVNTYAWIGF